MKVYLVEVGDYSDRYVDAIFTTEELAREYIVVKARIEYENDPTWVGKPTEPFPEPSDFETWNEWFDFMWDRFNVADLHRPEAMELWDTVPVVTNE